MPENLTAGVLKAFFVYAIPGIIALYVRAQFINGKINLTKDAILPYITLSVIYHAIVFPLAPTLYKEQPYHGYYVLLWFGLLFVAPAIFGLLLGLNVKKGWTKSLLARVGITTVHAVDCAWDWKFGNCHESWVLAVLKDGTKWAGLLSEQSFMSTSPTERDIIIAEVYEIDDHNKWTAKGSSVWIAHGELQSLEFWPKT